MNLMLGMVLATCAALGAADAPALRPLWPGQAPTGDGGSEAVPAGTGLTIYPAKGGNGFAVVICPGGGYGGRVSGPEGHNIARWLVSHGITGCVLDYRLPQGRPEVPLLDAQRAIRLLRAEAAQLGIDPRRIGVVGFSSGGHLAACAATMSTPGDPKATDAVERQSSRPDFAILVYPVISLTDALTSSASRSRKNLFPANPPRELLERWSAELRVDARTPPMYLAHAVDDKIVKPENSRVMHRTLVAAKIPCELLELPSGGHGLNQYAGEQWDAWQAGSLAWLAKLDLPKR